MNIEFDNMIKNRYYKGKLLRAEDFQKEQQYHQNSRNRSLALMYGKGIISGLMLTKREDNRVLLTNGYCINEVGQISCVPSDIDFEIEELNGFEMTKTNQLDVLVCYQEVECQATYATISEYEDNMENNYIQDSYVLAVKDSQRVSLYDSYFDKHQIFSNQEICISQSMPLYISAKDIFAITIHIENMTEHKHDVSFVYSLESPNIISAKGRKRIIIHGKIKSLEKEKVLKFYLKKDSRVGGSNYAYFTLKTDKAIVVIDGVQYPLECNYEKSLRLVENMPLFLNKVFQQESMVVEEQAAVKIATILIQRTMQGTNVIAINQNDDLFVRINRIQKKVDSILALYGIKEKEVISTDEIPPSIEEDSKHSATGVIELVVPGYRRYQEPICTKEIVHGLPGRVLISWSLERGKDVDLQSMQFTKQYYGDVTLFPEMEQQDYQIACKVIENKQAFKFAIKANRNTDHNTVYLRWYATLIEENTDFNNKDNTMKIQPEFVVVKPETPIVFTVVFNDARQVEICDYSIVESNEGTIDEEGKYIAPKNNGIYKIVAVGRQSNRIARAIVVVKDENT